MQSIFLRLFCSNLQVVTMIKKKQTILKRQIVLIKSVSAYYRLYIVTTEAVYRIFFTYQLKSVRIFVKYEDLVI